VIKFRNSAAYFYGMMNANRGKFCNNLKHTGGSVCRSVLESISSLDNDTNVNEECVYIIGSENLVEFA